MPLFDTPYRHIRSTKLDCIEDTTWVSIDDHYGATSKERDCFYALTYNRTTNKWTFRVGTIGPHPKFPMTHEEYTLVDAGKRVLNLPPNAPDRHYAILSVLLVEWGKHSWPGPPFSRLK